MYVYENDSKIRNMLEDRYVVGVERESQELGLDEVV